MNLELLKFGSIFEAFSSSTSNVLYIDKFRKQKYYRHSQDIEETMEQINKVEIEEISQS